MSLVHSEVRHELGLDLSAGNAEMIQMESLLIKTHSLDKETDALNQCDKGLIRECL